jgi:nucleoside 2-deoxyribosyltransferase
MKVYCAAPFFSPPQVAVVEKIENLLEELGIEYYSPRKDGVLMSMTREERRKKSKDVFDRNIEKMNWADCIVAVIDDRDQGVQIELGFCIGKRLYENYFQKIITYTEVGHGLNVMVQEAVDAHCKGIDRLKECLLSREYHKFRDYDAANVT